MLPSSFASKLASSLSGAGATPRASWRVLRRPSTLGAVALALPAIGLLGLACAESTGIDIAPDDPLAAGGGEPIIGPDGQTQCANPADTCGGGCCQSGEECSDGRCIATNACESNEDCLSDSFCGQSGRCQPWASASVSADSTCRNVVPLANVIPVVQCEWPGATAPEIDPDALQVVQAPMVADFDLDGDPTTIRPSIVFVSYEGLFAEGLGTLRIIDGETCEEQFSVRGEHDFIPEVSVALGDITGDGIPDIVVADREPFGGAATRDGLAAYDLSSGSPVRLWRERGDSSGDLSGISLADLDNDGIPEIFTANVIWNAAGQELEPLPIGLFEPPLVMDIDRLNEPEIITGQGLYRWEAEEGVIIERTGIGFQDTVAPLWDDTEKEAEMFVALADLVDQRTDLQGGMDSAELVMVGGDGDVLVKRMDGVTIHRVAGAGQAGGPPVIADFDGDGRMEFGSPGRLQFTVYDLDCKPGDFFNQQGCAGQANADAILWQQPVQGSRSGASVFDFDGDGRSEVVYADQCFMRIYDGRTGRVQFSVARSSVTQYAFPVVVDADGDSHTEIVTAHNDSNVTVTCPATDRTYPSARSEKSHGVKVWSDPDKLWAGSRPIWNQHAYYVNNVNDDGTVPATFDVKSSWDPQRNGGPNTFRQNVQGETGASVNIADLTTSGLANFQCLANGLRVTLNIELCNRGLLPLEAGEASAALARQVEGRTELLAEVTLDDSLEPGQCERRNVQIPRRDGEPPFDVAVVGDPNNDIDECTESNNRGTIANVFCAPAPR